MLGIEECILFPSGGGNYNIQEAHLKRATHEILRSVLFSFIGSVTKSFLDVDLESDHRLSAL